MDGCSIYFMSMMHPSIGHYAPRIRKLPGSEIYVSGSETMNPSQDRKLLPGIGKAAYCRSSSWSAHSHHLPSLYTQPSPTRKGANLTEMSTTVANEGMRASWRP